MAIQDAPKEGDQYLTLQLGDEHYGVEILRVREIIGLLDITRLPEVPSFVRGVVNLRGKIIPVIDLRMRLGMPALTYDERTCVVVLDLKSEAESGFSQVGCIVDTVNEVRHIALEAIEPPDCLGGTRSEDFIHGLAKLPESGLVVSLLDIDSLLSIALLGSADTTLKEQAAEAV